MYETMLIVDDSDMIRDILKVIFQDTYTVMEASSGEEALEILEACRENINIVLLDLNMKSISGIDILKKRQTMEFFKNIPVIVITASDATDDHIEAFKEGASDFITKPFVPEVVVTRVNNVMASSRRLQSILLESEKLKTKAELDQMTGLYNKVTIEELGDAILTTQAEKMHALFILDIDNFKVVNDTQGHQAGDQTIKIIANLIASQFRDTDIVGRIGGDEFAVLMTAIATKDIARKKAQDIVRIMKYKPNLTLPANVSVSIGLVFSEGKPESYADLFKKADQALYESKKEGKARYEEFGFKKINKKIDDRDAVLLMSREREVCGKVASVLDQTIHLCEIGTNEELDSVIRDLKGHIKFVCVDVMDDVDMGKGKWTKIRNTPELTDISKLAICKEGNMEQYKYAITEGAEDIISSPIEIDMLKRRIDKLLK